MRTVAAAPVVRDSCSEASDVVVLGFVAGVQGAEDEGSLVVEFVGFDGVVVDWLGGLEDWDVDGDHFGCVAEGWMKSVAMCVC